MKDYVNEHPNYLVDKFWYSGFTGFIFTCERKYGFFMVNPSWPLSAFTALTTLAREITVLLVSAAHRFSHKGYMKLG